ncbi:bifunctional biotin--[acetyl-CoA-carboxylase] synthetase/biotin operon repressor [Pseudoruegeria aquimaris]|uniref:Bifunctional biotin--[acetyl-CoA-carboxylase] synthetase/biotin operon repressor n=1 Tax=Pseudoruegeria aquimaris TaxID=393663 RepID=A0A1Y5SQM8_9RHOB|nr:YafY family protein [Pseudoruegeria aquimaris]SLN44404.1 bifunctional biotin--[acetyl-CoA-carboxylase] synthetase/biotin operon repressor [Pseudoruegeria aquimaris]
MSRRSTAIGRSGRLQALIQQLRGGQLHRARDLAAALGVSERTIYRDMDTLAASGLPIEGARGVGYRMTEPISLPPLTLTTAELEALQLGLEVVRRAGDRDLQSAARSLHSKIDTLVPETRAAPPAGWDDAIYPFAVAGSGLHHMPVLRQAIRQKRKIWLVYRNEEGRGSQRMIRPLHLEYWGRIWSCPAWCERRRAFRTFRVDRMETVELTSARFREEAGKSFPDYLASLSEPPA